MDDQLRELQLCELDLFKEVSAFCRAHHIKYYALGGTLLGAIRHKGFIPWDDDMDIGIPREDYDRLLEICRTENPPFIMRSFFDDPSYYRYFARAEDPKVQVRRHDNIKEEISNAWIDIFPLDGMPNWKPLRTFWKYYVLWRRATYKLSLFDTAVNVNKKNRPLPEKILVKIGLHFPVQKIFNTQKELRKLDRALKAFPYKKSNYLVNAMGAYKFNEMFHKKYYGKGAWYPFEDTRIFGPADYDTVCTQLYGDYMTPPPENNRNHHGLEVIHTNTDSHVDAE